MLTRLGFLRVQPSIRFSTRQSSSISVLGKSYPRDDCTNVREKVLEYVGRNVYLIPNHPIAILCSLVQSHFGSAFSVIPARSPLVTPGQNFDQLSFAKDHQGRRTSDSYYINKNWMLRTHTSAHEVEIFAQGNKKWLFTSDVYRRDEIDASHHLVFHQMEGARLWATSDVDALEEENQRLGQELARQDIVIEDNTHIGPSNPIQFVHEEQHARAVAAHLKHSLNGLMLKLFKGGDKEPLRVRWTDAFFPFTSPSYEVEVFHRGKWLELLGCGVVAQSTLDQAGVRNEIGWAFGLGLERIAMVLFQIPDIRLFWTKDERFLLQFQPGVVTPFKPYSKYPATGHDLSFWLPLEPDTEHPLHENDFYDLVREVAGDIVEDVKLIDTFVHPETHRNSHCYRIIYRSMDRTLTHDEVNVVMREIAERVKNIYGVEVR